MSKSPRDMPNSSLHTPSIQEKHPRRIPKSGYFANRQDSHIAELPKQIFPRTSRDCIPRDHAKLIFALRNQCDSITIFMSTFVHLHEIGRSTPIGTEMPQPASLDYLDNFRKIYRPAQGKTFDHVNSISHEGNMIVFVMEDAEIKYTVLGATDAVPNDADAWPDDLQTLVFPAELQIAGQEAIGNFIMPLVAEGQEIEPSHLSHESARELDIFSSTTARLGQKRDFHVVSTDMHVYVFRQSVAKASPLNVALKPRESGSPANLTTAATNQNGLLDNTVLVDRFVLVSSDQSMTLVPMRESRYQRSRNKSLPAARTDTLDQKDMAGQPFFEPTIALTMLPSAGAGGFCVMTVPSENGNGRWQFFVHDEIAQKIDGFSIARNEMGGFDFQGERFYTSPDPQYRPSVLERQPGQCPFTKMPLIPFIKEKLGEPRWVLKMPRTDDFFQTAPVGRLTLPLPVFDADGTCGMCVEFWIKPKSEVNLVSSGKDLVDNTKTLRENLWSHVQANCVLQRKDDKLVKEIRIDVDASNRNPVFLSSVVTASPSPIDLLREVLKLVTSDCSMTELRVFNLPRTAEMAINDRNYQLRGDEFFLLAYYPLAGGSDLILDDFAPPLTGTQAAAAGISQLVTAQANSQAIWILDNPPIQENPGIHRRSLLAVGARALLGMSCLLYHEQTAEKKDMSDLVQSDIRAMLAVTEALTFGDRDNVVVLDWNITPAGRLSRAQPLQIQKLETLRRVELEPSEDLLTQLKAKKAELQVKIRELDSYASEWTQAQILLAQQLTQQQQPQAVASQATPSSTAAWVQSFLNQQPSGLPPDAFAGMTGTMGGRSAISVDDGPVEKSPATEVRLSSAHIQEQHRRWEQFCKELKTVERSIRDLERLGESELHELYPEHSGAYRETMPVVGTDGLGCTLCAARLPFATTSHRATLFGAAGGTVMLYFANNENGLHAEIASATYDVKTVRHAIEHDFETTTGQRGTISFGSQQFNAASPSTMTRIDIVRDESASGAAGTLTIQASNPLLGIEEIWTGVPNNAAMMIDVVNGVTLPIGSSKVVKLHGNVFVDDLNAFPSRLIVARLRLNGHSNSTLQSVSPGVDFAGLASAWASEPTGYSFAALRRFVATLKDSNSLTKMHGDRAMTLESWVFPSPEDDDDVRPYQSIVWMKDTPVPDSPKIFRYGLGLTSNVTDRRLPSSALGTALASTASDSGVLAGRAFAFDKRGGIDIVLDSFLTEVTIEVLIKFKSPIVDCVFFKADGDLQLSTEFHTVLATVPGGDGGQKTQLKTIGSDEWHHLCIIVSNRFNRAMIRVLMDGTEYGQPIQSRGPSKRFGFQADNSVLHLAELRVWTERRSVSDIRALMGVALNAEASAFQSLIAYLPPQGITTPTSEAVTIPNYVHRDGIGITARNLTFAATPFRTVRYVFDDVVKQSVVGIRQQCWSHLAVRYAHAFGLTLNPALRIQADAAEAAIDRDMTIEMALQWTQSAATLLSQALEDDPDRYAFYFGVEKDGALAFKYSAIAGSSPTNPSTSHERKEYSFVSTARLTAGRFQTVAVRRWTRKVRITEYKDGSAFGEKDKFRETHRDEEQVTVDFFLDGQACGSFKVNEPIDILTREEIGEIPLYATEGTAIADLLKAAMDAKSPPTTMTGQAGKALFYAPKVEGTALPMVMGDRFDGRLYEARLWSLKYNIGATWSPPQGTQSGLTKWWRFEDGQGHRVTDAKDPSASWMIKDGKKDGDGTWVRSLDPESHVSTLYLNGVPVRTVADTGQLLTESTFSIGKGFSGLIDEVRIWNGLRTDEAIRDNLFVKIRDDLEDLIAYYPFSQDPAREVHDEGYAGADLTVTDTTATQKLGRKGSKGRASARAVPQEEPWTVDHHSLNDSPARREIGVVRTVLSPFHNRFVGTTHSAVWAQEYADMQMASDGAVAGAYKRAYACLNEGGLHLITGFKVGALTSEWVSQVQYDPQLLGYIEGAPPVPGENLTLGPKTLKMDYNSVSSIELVDAVTDKYIYSQSREKTAKSTSEIDATYSNTYGLKNFVIAPFGLGLTFEATLNFGGGYKGKFESTNGMVNKNGVINERESKKTTKFQVNGHWQSSFIDEKSIDDDTPSNPAMGYNKTLGLRFLPENKGLALVKSKTADIFALRLRGHRGIVAYRMLPSPDIPEDFNLMTFDINPKYTKQGTLDGRIGLDGNDAEGFKVFLDEDYLGSAGRGEYSYFKPREAYRLKSQIDREEASLATYFNSFDAQATGAAPGYSSLSSTLPTGIAAIAGSVGAWLGASAASSVASAAAAAAAAKAAAAAGTTVATSTASYGTLASTASALPLVLGPILSAAGMGMVGTNIFNIAKYKSAYEATPEKIKVDSARRNLMNTYAWTASGGFFELNTTQKDTFSETWTGKFTVQDLHGMQSDGGFDAKSPPLMIKAAYKMAGLAGNMLAVERSKQHDSSEGFSMKITLAPPNNIRHYRYMSQEDWNFAYHDPYGKTDLPGKVDAYRFATFFLDGKESHHDDFFEKVVDQKWLNQSSDPNAAALRPLKSKGVKSRPWRVMHRVTFVSRILPKITKADSGAPETIEQAMSVSQIQSNYELVTTLEPLLGGATGTVRSLKECLHRILPRFPLLLPFEQEIRELLVMYYGIPEHTQ